ncbi:hypothetical protein ACFQU3_20195 [Terrabacter sp. GCM10028922]|uniref:hypothetical protein n=1 Tax=Terrabacter sp. GCM10028922 TaxID=3273428 RepID=UPI00360BFB5A
MSTDRYPNSTAVRARYQEWLGLREAARRRLTSASSRAAEPSIEGTVGPITQGAGFAGSRNQEVEAWLRDTVLTVSGRWRPLEEADQLPDGVVAVQRVAKRKLVVDFVPIAASVAGLRQVAGCLEIADELSGRSLGDADGLGDVSEARGGIGGDADEHVGVVGDEVPTMIPITGINSHES